MKNRTLKFVPIDRDHERECCICGTRKAKDLKGAVVAVFHPEDGPWMAAVYCVDCIRRLYATAHPRKAVRSMFAPKKKAKR